jgi:hypothetical protein
VHVREKQRHPAVSALSDTSWHKLDWMLQFKIVLSVHYLAHDRQLPAKIGREKLTI